MNHTDDTLSLCQDDFLALKLETPQCRVKPIPSRLYCFSYCIPFAIYLLMTRKPRQLKTLFVQCFKYQNNIFTIINSIVNAAVYNHIMTEMQQLIIISNQLWSAGILANDENIRGRMSSVYIKRVFMHWALHISKRRSWSPPVQVTPHQREWFTTQPQINSYLWSTFSSLESDWPLV